jgi:hypothetical protein
VLSYNRLDPERGSRSTTRVEDDVAKQWTNCSKPRPFAEHTQLPTCQCGRLDLTLDCPF